MSLDIPANLSGPPAFDPCRIVLKGKWITVTPLLASFHAKSLFNESSGLTKHDLWRYLADGPFENLTLFNDYLQRKQALADPLFFALVDNASGKALGHAAFMRIEVWDRVVEVGSILFTPQLQKTVSATEAMYLMARHVFDDLGYRRYEWKCNALNLASKAAAVRLGFVYEGTFRQHRIVKGLNRDTAGFSMLDSEWPRCKQAFETLLDATNFDVDGEQVRNLAAIRNSTISVDTKERNRTP